MNIICGKKMRLNHDYECLWWKDWHSCSCGFIEEQARKKAYDTRMSGCHAYGLCISGDPYDFPCKNCPKLKE